MKPIFCISIFMFAAIACLPVLGQVSDEVSQEKGISTWGSYQGGDVDDVDLRNGNMSVRIPLFSLPQKGGLSLSYSLVYNTTTYTYYQDCQDGPPNSDSCVYRYIYDGNIGPKLVMDQALDIGYSAPEPADANLALQSPGWYAIKGADGSGHTMLFDSSNWTTLRAVDGTGFRYDAPSGSQPYYPFDNSVYVACSDGVVGVKAGVITTPSGIKYTAADCHSSSTTTMYQGDVLLAQGPLRTMTDPNGNQLTFNQYNEYNDASIVLGSVTDSLGRIIPDFTVGPESTNTSSCPNLGIPNQAPAFSKQWIVPGPNGGNVTYLFCFATISYNTNFDGGVRGVGTYPCVEDDCTGFTGYYELGAIGSDYALQSLTLPNGTYWAFVYDSAGPLFLGSGNPASPSGFYDPNASPVAYASLTKLIYPTGGSVTYGYAPAETEMSYLMVGSRYLSDGTTSYPPSQYSYTVISVPIFPPPASYTTTYTDPAGNDTVHTFSDVGPLLGAYPSETEVDYYSGSAAGGNLLKTDAKTYANQVILGTYSAKTGNGELQSETTGLIGGPTTTNSDTYTSQFSAVWPVCLADGTGCTVVGGSVPIYWGKPKTVTQTSTDGSVSQLITVNYKWMEPASPYNGANLLNLVSSVGTASISGSPMTSVTYGYDENNGSPQGIYGNRTSVGRWLNTTGGTVLASTVYNPQGMPTDTYDANLNTGFNGNHVHTTYDATGIFPQEIQRSTTGSTIHVDYFSYDPNTGNINWHTDENGNAPNDPAHTTSYYHEDPFGRLTRVVNPPTPPYGQGETDITYNDLAGTVTEIVTASPSPAQTSSQTFDGLARQVRTVAASGASSETVYDSMGRAASISNLHFSTQSSSDGYTSYDYDALGRIHYQCQPDNGTGSGACVPGNAYLQWTYNGNITTKRDELGHLSTQANDALGRLSKIVEQGTLTTFYTYDPQNNLIGVSQIGNGTTDTPRTRNFTHDSLSRLICASNPENSHNQCPSSAVSGIPSGVTTYSYDPNGNVQYKTDARGVQTHYTYDALNRLTGKYYSNDPSSTTNTCYQYDTVAGTTSSANPIGRMTAEWTQSESAGTCSSTVPSTGALTAELITAYDALGRVKHSQQCVLGNCASGGVPFSLTQGYDLAGNTVNWTDGLNQILFTQHYDTAGRLQTLTSSWSDVLHPSTLFSSQSGTACGSSVQGYNAAGALQNWMLGNNLGVTRCYDSRLRVTSETATVP